MRVLFLPHSYLGSLELLLLGMPCRGEVRQAQCAMEPPPSLGLLDSDINIIVVIIIIVLVYFS